ncbi:clarin-3 isoform X1 [Paramormyrops kingsleyae]|uniref:clarin-3 isoform X1 n=1 Tax=Paramormyrops kingsleyae TaxID=1676925 RepID=UPI000CD614EF|nr:clarin-3 isoform X1 [Paramormyrops kingsleyae]
MPSLQKVLHFLGGCLFTMLGVGLTGFGMSDPWAASKLECASQGSNNLNSPDFYNGTADISFGLFSMVVSRDSCPSFGATNTYATFQKLEAIGGPPLILHSLVISLLLVSLITSAGTIFITFYNSVSNPYQTHLGPSGVYTCCACSVIFAFLALVLFLVNVFATNLWQAIVLNEVKVNLRNVTVSMRLGFYLLIPFLVTSSLAIVVIVLYQHVAYTHQKEQQRPTEDAPKEIMMY